MLLLYCKSNQCCLSLQCIFTSLIKTYMKKYFFVITFILFATLSTGQESYFDFDDEDNLHKKTEIAYSLLFKYMRNNLDSLRLLSTQLLLLGKENNFDYSTAMGENGLGSYFLRTGKQEEAIQHLKSSLVYFKSIGDYQIVSEILNEIGNSYAMDGAYSNAIESYIASIDFGSISKDETASFNGKIGLAKAYFALGDTLKGEMTMHKYIKECIKHEKYQSVSNAYSYLGMIEQDKGNLEESFSYLDRSIFYGLKSDSKIQLSHVYTNKAILFFTTESYDSSLYYFERALDLRKELNQSRQICESYFNLASFYIERGNLEEAITQVNQSIDIAKRNSLIQDEYDGVELLEFIYGEMEDSIAQKKQTKLLKDLSLKLDEKKELNKELVSYINEIEASIYNENFISKPKENKSWMLIAGALIIIIAGVVVGKGLFKKSDR